MAKALPQSLQGIKTSNVTGKHKITDIPEKMILSKEKKKKTAGKLHQLLLCPNDSDFIEKNYWGNRWNVKIAEMNKTEPLFLRTFQTDASRGRWVWSVKVGFKEGSGAHHIYLLNKQLNSMAVKISGTKPRIQESSECEENDATFWCSRRYTYSKTEGRKGRLIPAIGGLHPVLWGALNESRETNWTSKHVLGRWFQ